MTQQELAEAAEIGRCFLSRVETGRFSVTLETVGALAKALHVAPSALIEKAPPGATDPCSRPARGRMLDDRRG